MENSEFLELFKQANLDLKSARKELAKPKEDVVTYSVCFSARRALYFLMSCLYQFYGQENDDVVDDHPTLDEMIKYCEDYDEEVHYMDFRQIYCRKRDVLDEEAVFYCNDVYKVKTCIELAGKLEELVEEVIWSGEYPKS